MMRKSQSDQRGMSLIEMMIACVVLLVGVLAAASLIPLAIGTNSRNRQQSNSTVIAQMIMEKILSVPPGAPTPTLTDCTGTSTTINATGTSTPGSGATLLSNGDADFTQTAGSAGDPAGYYKLYTVCGSNGQQSIYDVRWHIVTPSPYVMQVTVSAKLQGSNNNAVLFSPTVSIRSMIGQGN
jgi:prepilin-type N-terminal cleavage/methylation domain-containing protein